MPEGMDTTGSASVSAPAVEEILKARNIDPAKLGDILDGYSRDVPELRQRAKMAAEEKAELEALRKAKADADAAGQTELEKAQARIAALEKAEADAGAEATKAHRGTLLERVLSKRLAQYADEAVRAVADDLYRAAASAEYADENELTALLEPVDAKLQALQPGGGQQVRMTSGVRNPGGQTVTPGSQAAKDFTKLSYPEKVAAARRLRKAQ